MTSTEAKDENKKISISIIPRNVLSEEKEKEIRKKILKPLKNKNQTSNISLLDAPEDFEKEIQNLLENTRLDVVLTIGGTGIGRKEDTVEVLKQLFDKEIPGFGELLRFYANEKLGIPQISDRSIAGKKNRKLIFCLPEDPEVAEIGVQLIEDDLKDMLEHAGK